MTPPQEHIPLLPWEQNGLSGFSNTLRNIILRPSATFQSLDPGGPWGAPARFVLLNALLMTLGALVAMLAQRVSLSDPNAQHSPLEALADAPLGESLALLALTPPAVLLNSFALAGLLHLALRLLGGAHVGYRATWRMVAYGHSLQAVLGLVCLTLGSCLGAPPVIVFGGLLGGYSIVLWGLGLRTVHRTSAARAFGAVALVLASLGLLSCLVLSPLLLAAARIAQHVL